MSSLRNRLILSYLLPVLIVFPLLFLALIYLIERHLLLPSLTKELADGVYVMSQIAQDHPEIWQDVATADQFIQRFHPDPEDHLLLFSPTGRLLATSDSARLPAVEQLPTLALSSTIGVDGVTIEHRYRAEYSANVIDAIALVQNLAGQTVGFVRLTYPLDLPYSYLQRFRYYVALIGLAGLLVRIAIGWPLTMSLERSLGGLTQAIERFGRGEITVVPENGVTEVRMVASAFNKLNQQLRVLESTRQQLLLNLIHEIRRPLGALQSAVYALAHGASEHLTLRQELLTGMADEVRRLQRMTDDLALLYQQSLGKFQLQRQPVDLSSWLPAILAPWRASAQTKAIAWQVDLSVLPPALVIDGDRLAQSLGNILNNAIKFTQPGGVITIRSGLTANTFWLRVSDTGEGISLEEQSRIFEPFYRSSAHRTFPQGMGLGLSIARDLVVAHGGRLTVESTEGTGSNFTIWLPV